MLKAAKIFIWNKALMTNKVAFEAMDRLLCDIININQSFGEYFFCIGQGLLINFVGSLL